ncbi:MAG: DNA primase [Rhodospirillaceae bacterium]
MAFPPNFLDDIRTRLPVSSVVGRRVRLIKRGREYVGLSPFSNEKTPSFTVNDEKGFYHCFSTQEHGDIFSFLMKTQNLSFVEAVERLAEEAGLEMPRATPQDAAEAARETKLREAAEAGCSFFEQMLHAPDGRHALEYLRNRGLSDATIKRFRLGYAPNGNQLKTKLTARGVKEDLLLDVRLVSPGKEGRESFDFFRDRVMFPILDMRGRPVAFGGRVMGEGEPKYLNSPDTPLFHKGQMLYNFSLARAPAGDKRDVIVAEGYMDVIGLSQAGFTHAVAPLGTAMTEGQLAILWRLAPEPILCFDGDRAGRAAALRAAERALPLLKPGLSLRFAMMPAGKDPDDICRREGAAAMQAVLGAAVPLSEVVWQQLLAQNPADTPERRAGLERAAQAKAGVIGDESVQAQYRQHFRNRLFELFRAPRAAAGGQGGGFAGGKGKGFRPASGQKGATPGRFAGFPPPRTSGDPDSARKVRERILLATLLTHPDIFDHVEERLGRLDFADSRLDLLRQTALIHVAQDPELDFGGLQAHLANTGFAAELETLLNSNTYVHAGFARPTAPKEQAISGWDHTFALCQRADLEADLKRAELELAENPSEHALAVFEALQRQVRPPGDEDSDEL